MSRATVRLALAAAVFLVACGADRRAPVAPAGVVADRRLAAFVSQVVPVLDRRCGNCHGVPADTYRALQEEPSNRTLLRWAVDAGGRIASAEQQALAYQRCTADQEQARVIDRRYPAIVSALVAAPLATAYAGTRFVHPEVFATPSDPDYRALAAWVEQEIAAAPAPAPVLATAAEQFFAASVVPILDRKGCLGTNCHGRLSFSDLKLEAGIPALPGRFTSEMHAKNRIAMLGGGKGQARLVNLAGDVTRSRQLAKNIPIAQGGILHKAGNGFFDVGDADYLTLLAWLELEAASERARLGVADFAGDGLVFVRRPRATPERTFEDAGFLGGADLYWRRGAEEINLTAALHDGPADIRAPDVSFDATRVLFALRRSAGEPFNVWELVLATRQARQLTFSDDPAVHYLDPIYVPDPDDRAGAHQDQVAIAVVSNVAGEWAQVSPDGILGEADGGTKGTILDQQRSERAGSFAGRTVRIVRGTNAGQTRRITRQAAGRLDVDRPFAAPCDSTTHYVIDAAPRLAPSYDLYRMRHAPAGEERASFAATLSRMTWALGQVRRPSMRSTGEIFFTSLRTGWQDDRPFFNGAVFRTHDNGSNFHTHYGNRSQLPILADNHELVNGLEVHIGQDAESYWGGQLVVADHQFGPAIDPDNPLDDLDHPYRDGAPPHSLHTFFRGWVSLDPAVTGWGVSPGGAYRDPYPLPDGSLLVAYAPGPLDLSDAAAAPDFDIVQVAPAPSWHSEDGLAAGAITRAVVAGGPGAELWPRPVVVRPKPPFHKALKWDEQRSGKPGVVRGFAGFAPGTPALLEVYDLILLAAFFEQNVPAGAHHLQDALCTVHGDALPEWRQITWARVVGAAPLRRGEHGPPRRFILAEVPLAEDGSFQLLLPPGVPFDLQALDSERMALGAPERWLYALPGEKHSLSIPRALFAQTCEGCHGALSGVRTASFGRPDVVTSASRTLAMWDAGTRSAKPPPTDPALMQRVALGFAEDVRPLLAARCTSCHAGTHPAGGLDLAGEGAYAALRRFVDAGGLSTRSALIEKLTGRELGAPAAGAGDGPHPVEGGLAADELLLLTRWIDLGAPPERAILP